MKVTGFLTLVTAALAATASAAPSQPQDLEQRASIKFDRGQAAALRSQTQSTISQLRNLRANYDSRVNAATSHWSGSASQSILQSRQRFDQSIAKADEALDQIVARLNQLLR
jgi:uncharacterized protein YukE